MFADVMGLPVETVIADEAGVLGCAIACSVAVGDAADVPSAVGRMVRVAHTFEPDARAHDVYECKYHLYRKATRALDGFWDELNELME